MTQSERAARSAVGSCSRVGPSCESNLDERSSLVDIRVSGTYNFHWQTCIEKSSCGDRHDGSCARSSGRSYGDCCHQTCFGHELMNCTSGTCVVSRPDFIASGSDDDASVGACYRCRSECDGQVAWCSSSFVVSTASCSCGLHSERTDVTPACLSANPSSVLSCFDAESHRRTRVVSCELAGHCN